MTDPHPSAATKGIDFCDFRRLVLVCEFLLRAAAPGLEEMDFASPVSGLS